MMRTILLIPLMLINLIAASQTGNFLPVKIVRNDADRRVDIFVGDKLFTSYLYVSSIEKPVLYPISASNGTFITRGFPLKTRSGERVDHPHHLGMWFNFGDVNGIDFWNNSYAIPENEKKKYGKIIHKKILEISINENSGKLVVESEWADYLGNILMNEETTFIFSGNETSRFIDRTTKLTSEDNKVIFGDNKEGLVAVRVDRAFESSTNEPLIFSDASGKPTKVAVLDNTGVNGLYRSSSGFEGDSVWGTRNKWVTLSAKLNGTEMSLAFFDHPANHGYPAHAHARGYGLFALNNFGQNVFNPTEPVTSFELKANSSITFKYLFVIQCGKQMNSADADRISAAFEAEK
jgi:hypothetical protein